MVCWRPAVTVLVQHCSTAERGCCAVTLRGWSGRSSSRTNKRLYHHPTRRWLNDKNQTNRDEGRERKADDNGRILCVHSCIVAEQTAEMLAEWNSRGSPEKHTGRWKWKWRGASAASTAMAADGRRLCSNEAGRGVHWTLYSLTPSTRALKQ